MQSSFVSREAATFREQTGVRLEVIPAGSHHLRGRIESNIRYLLHGIRWRHPSLKGLVIKQRPMVQTGAYWDVALQHTVRAFNDNTTERILEKHGAPYTRDELLHSLKYDGRSPRALPNVGTIYLSTVRLSFRIFREYARQSARSDITASVSDTAIPLVLAPPSATEIRTLLPPVVATPVSEADTPAVQLVLHADRHQLMS
mmetsp:Transcript_8449/g.26044  ORF Transcript_8449/g.26044 Transcript_8449/m.26044 type:complete len:201 (-) Transcript_8449:2367-2969(-)